MNIFQKMYGGAMDRRQKKTRDAIFSAFGSLLERKRYENITVQEIIDAANICRSTFYTHFETKDMLLREMCADIFDHVFAVVTMFDLKIYQKPSSNSLAVLPEIFE